MGCSSSQKNGCSPRHAGHIARQPSSGAGGVLASCSGILSALVERQVLGREQKFQARAFREKGNPEVFEHTSSPLRDVQKKEKVTGHSVPVIIAPTEDMVVSSWNEN